jgi:hypothetical protein
MTKELVPEALYSVGSWKPKRNKDDWKNREQMDLFSEARQENSLGNTMEMAPRQCE